MDPSANTVSRYAAQFQKDFNEKKAALDAARASKLKDTDIRRLRRELEAARVDLAHQLAVDYIQANKKANLTTLGDALAKRGFTSLMEIQPPPTLTELDLSYNVLEQLPPELFASLPLLQTFRCVQNGLRELPPIAACKGLLELDLRWNRLTTLPDLSKLESLQKLWVSYNMLTELPTGFNNKSLVELVVDNNRLRELPPLKDFKKLQLLAMSKLGSGGTERKDKADRFTEIPDLYGCVSLREVYCCHNHLKTIHPSLFELGETLQKLYLKGNKIAELPAAFIQLKKLKELDLSLNRLTRTAKSVGALENMATQWVDFMFENAEGVRKEGAVFNVNQGTPTGLRTVEEILEKNDVAPETAARAAV